LIYIINNVNLSECYVFVDITSCGSRHKNEVDDLTRRYYEQAKSDREKLEKHLNEVLSELFINYYLLDLLNFSTDKYCIWKSDFFETIDIIRE
jgi:hypothetical protein